MALKSPRFTSNPRIQKAAENNPPLRRGETSEAVWILQQALLDLGYPMPISTKKYGSPDGIYGAETFRTVYQFQTKYSLSKDGVAGRQTFAKLDELLPNAGKQPPRPGTDPATGLPYRIPGIFQRLTQPTGMACWATAATMMLSWKQQMSLTIETAMQQADANRTAAVALRISYLKTYKDDTGLVPSEFGDFLNTIGVSRAPMACYPIATWLALLKAHGPLWVGTLAGNTANSGLHSRIIVAMTGDGTVDGTFMVIADPADGTEYSEAFSLFTFKYEQAFVDANSDVYYQIRHF